MLLTEAMVAPGNIFTVFSVLTLSIAISTLINIYHGSRDIKIDGKSHCCLPMQKFPAFLYPVAQSLHLLGPHPLQPPSQDLSQSERGRRKVGKEEQRRERGVKGRALYQCTMLASFIKGEPLTITFVTAIVIFTELPFFAYWLVFLALINVWGWWHYWHVNTTTLIQYKYYIEHTDVVCNIYGVCGQCMQTKKTHTYTSARLFPVPISTLQTLSRTRSIAGVFTRCVAS